MTIESELAAITTSAVALTTVVGTALAKLNTATAGFSTTTDRVNALSNVNNTPDLTKPVSAAAQLALDTKQDALISGKNIKRVNGQDLLGEGDIVIVRSATSLNKVLYDNRATLRATTSQVDDTTLVESLGLFMWTNTQLEPDDDETCFNTAATGDIPAGQWLLQAPAWELISAWALYETAVTDDWREDEPARFAAYLLNK